MKIHSGIVEVCVAELIGYRNNVIVPNVSWGLGLNHECDLLVLDKQGRFTEVEIKVSTADLKADFKKQHGHRSKFISRLIYAMPEELCKKHLDLIPENCGLIGVTESNYNKGNFKAYWIKQCRHDKTKTKPEQKMIDNFYRLGCMRIWSLKKHNNRTKWKQN